MESNWPQQQRLKFIEHSLLWLRGVTATKVANTFNISRQHAQSDIAAYRELAGGNAMQYSPSAKKHIPTQHFKPVLTKASPIGFIAQGGLSDFDSKIVLNTPYIERKHIEGLVPVLLTAIDEKRNIELLYASMRSPEGKVRLLQPKALIYCLNRFHLRAYSYKDGELRDYALSRTLEIPKVLCKSSDVVEGDIDVWVDLELKANTHLSTAQRKLIQNEYGLHPTKVIRIRKCLVGYFLRENFLPSSEEQLSEAIKKPDSFPVIARVNGEILEFK